VLRRCLLAIPTRRVARLRDLTTADLAEIDAEVRAAFVEAAADER
jgi:hypothetical protein